jgi:hypothetical protein
MKNNKINGETVRDFFNSMISITDLSKGKAPKIIQNACINNETYFVIKNNKPIAVIMPLCSYEDLLNKIDKSQSSVHDGTSGGQNES